jgi:protein-S-isoprenylcysteine O-methyltransferase Ste14
MGRSRFREQPLAPGGEMAHSDSAMITVMLQLTGVVTFILGTFLLRQWLLSGPTPRVTRSASRLSHLLFHGCLFWPYLAGGLYPGFHQFDAIIGWRPLPLPHLWRGVGIVLVAVGLGLDLVSFWVLGREGKGLPSFVLVKRIVTDSLYKRVRNPIALGWYQLYLGLSLIAGSTYLTLLVLLAYIPAHILFLKCFEELELETRFGEAYRQYKRSVPFLIPRFSPRPNATGSGTQAARAPGLP